MANLMELMKKKLEEQKQTVEVQPDILDVEESVKTVDNEVDSFDNTALIAEAETDTNEVEKISDEVINQSEPETNIVTNEFNNQQVDVAVDIDKVNEQVITDNQPEKVVDNQLKDAIAETTPFVNFAEVSTNTKAEAIKSLEMCKQFKYNECMWSPHKFSIGDVVYVPQDEQTLKSTIFDPICTEQRMQPKKLTVATVVITNKVSYTFKESSKILAHEAYVFSTKEDCQKMCEVLNN